MMGSVRGLEKLKIMVAKNSPEESHIGFLFELAGKKKSDKIAPAFVDLYNADWISRPISHTN